MSLVDEITYSDRVSEIEAVQFGLLSPERIRAQSVAQIYRPLTNLTEVIGTIDDPRLGATERNRFNYVSKLEIKHDPGNFGHLELAKPVVTSSQNHKAIIKILNSVCYRCAALKINQSDTDLIASIKLKQGKNRFNYVTKRAGDLKDPCYICGAPSIKFKDPRDSDHIFQITAVIPEIVVKKKGPKTTQTGSGKTETKKDEDTPEEIDTDKTEPKKTETKKTAAKKAGKTEDAEPDEDADADDRPDDDKKADVDRTEDLDEGEDEDIGRGKKAEPEEEDVELLKHFNTEVCHSILSRISDQDVVLLGLNPQYARPEWMIWTVMPIPPPSMRPSVETEDGLTSSDDLTNKLNEVVKTNSVLVNLLATESDSAREKVTIPVNRIGVCRLTNKIMDQWCLLQYHVATYIDNEFSGLKKKATSSRSSRPLKTLRQRIKSKRGRIRRNLMGKRVNYSARSVITPGADISIDQVGIPLNVAMTLNWPEIVTPYNFEFLTKLVRNGPYTYPGANYIKEMVLTVDGIVKPQMRQLRYIDFKNKNLSLGTVVYRHLMDDDAIFFNRQPSLHKMSMMTHRAKIMKIGLTFRLNASVTSPYNADFDGDEMNIHVPRSLQTKVELIQLTSVPTQVVSPQASKPVMGLVQDSLLGCYRFTSDKARLGQTGRPGYYNYDEVMHILQSTNVYTGVLPPPDDFYNPETIGESESDASGKIESKKTGSKKTGKVDATNEIGKVESKQAESESDEEDESGKGETGDDKSPDKSKKTKSKKTQKSDDKMVPYWSSQTLISYILPQLTYSKKTVKMVNGNVSANSVLDDETVGKGSGGLTHVIWNDFGPETTRHMLDNLAHLAKHWLLKSGFSVGFQDISIKSESSEKNHNTLKKELAKIQTEFIDVVHQGGYVKSNRPSVREQFEMDINLALNNVKNEIEKQTYNEVPATNRIHNMVTSGSKGKKSNIVQIMAILGQQDMEGGRIPDYFYRRTLPHFYKDSIEPEAKGFVIDNFMIGLSPTNYWAHAQTGRIGVISTSIKTAETGYIQRKLIKVMEDAQVRPDGTVRNSLNLTLQFMYGDDGFDASRLETVSIKPIVTPSYYHNNESGSIMAEEMTSYYFSSFHLFSRRFEWTEGDLSRLDSLIYPSVYHELIKSPGDLVELGEQMAKLEYKPLKASLDILRLEVFPGMVPEQIMLPFNFRRLIVNVQERMKSSLPVSDLNPIKVIKAVNELIEKIVRGSSHLEFIREHTTRILVASLRANLASKYLIELRVNQAQFEVIKELVFQKIMGAYVAPGEMVGSIAAQSIGEPTTQLTLRVFHSAGQGSAANVTRGVPRMKEIMDLSKNPKGPSYSLVLQDWKLYEGIPAKAARASEEAYEAQTKQIKLNVKKVMDELVYTTLKDICEGVQVIGYTMGEDIMRFSKEEQDIICLAQASPGWKDDLAPVKGCPKKNVAQVGRGHDETETDETVTVVMDDEEAKEDDEETELDDNEETELDDNEESESEDDEIETEVEAEVETNEDDDIKQVGGQGDDEEADDAADKTRIVGAKDEDAGVVEATDEIEADVDAGVEIGDEAESEGEAEAIKKTVWIIHFKLNDEKFRSLGQRQLNANQTIYIALTRTITSIQCGGPGKKKWTDLKVNYNYAKTADPNELYFQVIVTDLGRKCADNPVANLRVLTKKLEGTQIGGIVGIVQAYCREDKKLLERDDGSLIPPLLDEYNQWKTSRNYQLKIDTNNQNTTQSLYQLFNMPEIEAAQVYSNNIQEIMNVLGIEAARRVIIDEAIEVLEFAGTKINYRHIDLLADVMTVQGYLVPVSRYGVNKSDNGPWSRASFEETASQVSAAALFSERDPMTGVTPNIMFGQFIKSGTNASEVLMDESILEKIEPPKQVGLEVPLPDRRPVKLGGLVNNYCLRPENFMFNFVML